MAKPATDWSRRMIPSTKRHDQNRSLRLVLVVLVLVSLLFMDGTTADAGDTPKPTDPPDNNQPTPPPPPPITSPSPTVTSPPPPPMQPSNSSQIWSLDVDHFVPENVYLPRTATSDNATWTFVNWNNAFNVVRSRKNINNDEQLDVRIPYVWSIFDGHLKKLVFKLDDRSGVDKTHPTLEFTEDSFTQMDKLQNLTIINFDVKFTSSQKLTMLSFENCNITQFNCRQIDTVEIVNSTMTKFPSVTYSKSRNTTNIKTLVMRNVTISQAIVLNQKDVEALQHIDFNLDIEPSALRCENPETLHNNESNTDLHFCRDPISPSITGGGSNHQDSSQAQQQNPNSGNGNARMTTVLIIVGVLGGLVLVIGGFIMARHRLRRRSQDPGNSYILTPPASGSASLLTGPENETREKVYVMGDTGALNELEIPAEDVVVGQKLGVHGLWRAEYLNTNVVMLKVFTNEKSKAAMKEFDRAVFSLVSLRHANVMRFIGWVRIDRGERGVLVEHMQKGALRSLLANPKVDLSWNQRLRFAQDICCGLSFVQSINPGRCTSPILGTQRIFCDAEFNCKLNIFDYSSSLKDTVKPFASYGMGMMAYQAPEALLHRQTTKQSQIYALGVIFCELSSQLEPYHDMITENGCTIAELMIAQRVATGELTPECTGDAPEAFQQLTAKCLSFDPNDRPTLSEISKTLSAL